MYVTPVPRCPTVIEYSIGFTKADRAAPCRGVARRDAAWASRSTGHTPIFDPRQKLRGGSTTDTANFQRSLTPALIALSRRRSGV